MDPIDPRGLVAVNDPRRILFHRRKWQRQATLTLKRIHGSIFVPTNRMQYKIPHPTLR
jgi:hypothetical protein